MIGIYHAKAFILYAKAQADGELKDFRYELSADLDLENEVSSSFEAARHELGFSNRDDFQVIVDCPLAYAIAQTVPFAEKQLPQVAENYLEDELPDDIDDFVFDYHVLSSESARSAILGNWIKRNVLSAWAELAEASSLNSLSLQPAEFSLLKPLDESGTLVLRHDPEGRLRWGLLVYKNNQVSMVTGRLPNLKFSLEEAARCFALLSIPHDQIVKIEAPESLRELAEHLSAKWGKTPVEILSADNDLLAFSHWACGLEPPAFSFNYRKGEFAPRALHEKVLVPACIFLLALIFLVQAMAWKTRKEVLAENVATQRIIAEKIKIFSSLFPNDPVPHHGSIVKKLQDKYGELGTGDLDPDSEKESSLQTIGSLFKGLDIDKQTLITDINISNGINMRGSVPDSVLAARIESSLQENAHFDPPNLRTTLGKSEGDPMTFQLVTKVTVKKDSK